MAGVPTEGTTVAAPTTTTTPAAAAEGSPQTCPVTGSASSSSLPADPALPVENTALKDGVWQTDSSTHTLDGRLKGRDIAHGTVRMQALKGRPTLRVAYFFSGTERKASIANVLKDMCSAEGSGLEFHEIDTLVGGEDHDLTDPVVADQWIGRVEDG